MAKIHLKLFFLSFACLKYVTCQMTTDMQCYDEKQDFKTTCEDKYRGVAVGARCFFVPDGLWTWTDAWDACKSRGAVMAQVHTSGEFAQIGTYLQGRSKESDPQNSWVWIAIRREKSVQKDECFLSLAASFWYERPGKLNTHLAADKTWIRTHRCDDAFSKDQLCVVIWQNASQFGDWSCDVPQPPLCQLTNQGQEFMELSGICIGEDPPDTYSSADVGNCAKRCTQLAWCRSFNFIENRACEFFTWSIYDQPLLKQDSGCVHYTQAQ